MTSLSYFIAGCGHFGKQAVKQLLGKSRRSQIVVVDKDKEALQTVSSLPVEVIAGEGVHCLDHLLSQGRNFDYIVPAVPFHFILEFILAKMTPWGAKRDVIPSLSGLPNPIKGKTGDLYTSLADFLCPEDCPEPSTYCSFTGRKRPKPLYKLLMETRGSFEPRVIRSYQLGLGVGGIRLKTLLDLVEDVRKWKPTDPLLLISTASRCHGVTSALSLRSVD
ncbi:MAG: NAD-binding protein [Deltaproteobacteria bacterium]